MLVNSPGAHDSAGKVRTPTATRCRLHGPEGQQLRRLLRGPVEVQIPTALGRTSVPATAGITRSRRRQRLPGAARWVNASNAPGDGASTSASVRRVRPSGKKIANAKFEDVKLNGTLIQENVEVENPTRGGFDGPEAAWGPLRLQGDHGPVAFKKVRLKRLDPPPGDAAAAAAAKDAQGFARMFDGKTLDGWKKSGNAKWTVEDGAIVGRGDAGHLFSPRGDYVNFEQRARVVINDAGNSGFYFRTAFGDGFPAGYEAQVDSSHPDPQRTGSLYGMAKVTVAPVPPNIWFDYKVRCVDESAGTHIQIWVNGFQTVDFMDTARTYKSGHLALQQHNEGSEARVKDVEVRELK